MNAVLESPAREDVREAYRVAVVNQYRALVAYQAAERVEHWARSKASLVPSDENKAEWRAASASRLDAHAAFNEVADQVRAAKAAWDEVK